MKPRTYQIQAIEDLRAAASSGHNGAILEMPTGSGKTFTAAAIVRSAMAKRAPVLWLAHRRELIAQATRTLTAMGLGEHIASGMIMMRTQQTRDLKLPNVPRIAIVDEGHRALSKSYRKHLAACPGAFVILLTGTAWRSDGKDFSTIATARVLGPQIAELQNAGYLVRERYFAPPGPDLADLKRRGTEYTPASQREVFDQPSLTGDVVAHYQRLAAGRPFVCYASGVDHATHLAAEFIAAGVACAALSGSTPKDERAQIIADMDNGVLAGVVNCEVLVEGWDCPRVSCVILARATGSQIIYRQCIGRGLRPYPGKTDCLVIDHGASCEILGAVSEPLTYEPGERAPNPTGKRQPRKCPACAAVMMALTVCRECGETLPPPKQLKQVGGALVEVKPKATKAETDWKLWREIDVVRRARRYARGWTWVEYARRRRPSKLFPTQPQIIVDAPSKRG